MPKRRAAAARLPPLWYNASVRRSGSLRGTSGLGVSLKSPETAGTDGGRQSCARLAGSITVAASSRTMRSRGG
jgi:hypothetical protein